MKNTSLSPQLISAWRKTAISACKPLAEPNEAKKIKRLIHRERAHMKRVWIQFNTERTQIRTGYLNDKATLAAYLLGFHLPNAARFQSLLRQAQLRHSDLAPQVKQASHIRVIDLGAGTGAAAQGCAEWLQQWEAKSVSIELFDTSRPALNAAEKMFAELNLPSHFSVHATALKVEAFQPRNIKSGDLQIVLMSYVWNELYNNPKAQAKLIQHLDALAAKNPTLLFFSEPSNEAHARFMMQLRDTLSSRFQVLYPCTRQAPCPMLESHRDWCFSESDWDRPTEVALVDELLDLDRSRLSFSGYIFASQPMGDNPSDQDRTVLVGRPVSKASQKPQLLLCNSEGLQTKSAPPGPLPLRGDIVPNNR